MGVRWVWVYLKDGLGIVVTTVVSYKGKCGRWCVGLFSQDNVYLKNIKVYVRLFHDYLLRYNLRAVCSSKQCLYFLEY